MFLADGRNFYRKYLQDLRFCQRQDGAISSIAPAITGFQYGSPGWADALPIITWELYRKSADMRILRENYPAIKAHIEYELSQAENFVLNGHPDHLSLSRITTDTHLIGTVFFHNTARIATAIANILGEKNEVAEFKTLAGNIRRAFRNNFLTEDGILKVPTQCGFALLFYFDMLDTPEEKRRNAESFAKLIRDNRNLLDTGFLGTAYLCPALVQAGLPSIACDLLLQRDFPSWLFEVNQGATTVWERWDSYHPDKGFATPLMNSFNHYANGAIGEFIFNWLGGIDFRAVDENGDAAPAICFRMIPDPRIGNARTVLDTPCGEALCQWELRNDTLQCHLQVPPNTIAYLHDWGKGEKLLPGTYDFNFSVRQ
jgi:alpha-L-rhamnosidase